MNEKEVALLKKFTKRVDLISDFKVMLAEKVDGKVKPKFPCWGSPKLDGYRAPSFKVNGQRGLYSREGRFFDSYSAKLAGPLEKVNEQLRIRFPEGAENLIFDGEAMAADYAETSSARAKDSQHALVYHMFDCLLGWESDDFDPRIAAERYLFLEVEVQKAIDEAGVGDQVKIVKHTVIKDESEMVAFFEKCVADGYEGAMFTNIDSKYERDRVRDLLKMKPVRKTTVDCEIIEVLPGKAGTKYEHTMGSIVVRGKDENGVEFQANCGSGIPDSFRKEWQGRWSELLGHIAELNYDCITQDKDTGLFSLRFPRMRGLRFDKTKV